jgi:hypothetical protein
MEATAVLESLHTLDPNLTIDKLMNKLPTGDDTYSRVFGIMIRALSPRATLKLTQMLVYSALNNAQPGDAFCKMVYKLSNVLLSQLDKKSPGDILDYFMAERENSLLDGFADNRRPSASPFWNKVGHAFATSGERRLMHLIAAYPSSLIAENNWSRQVGPGVKEAAPLMFAFEDGTGRITNELPNNDVTIILTANELIGVMYKVGADKGYETLCRQMNCPSRGTHLCHMAYPVAPADKWKNCGFRARFKQISGMLPEEFDIWLKGGSGRPSWSKSILVMVAGALRNLAALLKSLFAST